MAQMCISETVITCSHQCHLPALDGCEKSATKSNNSTHAERVPLYPLNGSWVCPKTGGLDSFKRKISCPFHKAPSLGYQAHTLITTKKYTNPVPVNFIMCTYCTLLCSCSWLKSQVHTSAPNV